MICVVQIVVDTREQYPYEFEGAVTRALVTGDYSLAGLEAEVAVERKTKSDAYGSLSHGRARFEREVARLAELEYGAIVVECSLFEFAHEPPAHSGMHPRAATESLLGWSVKYRVPVFWCSDRRSGQAVTRSLLTHYARYRTEGRLVRALASR